MCNGFRFSACWPPLWWVKMMERLWRRGMYITQVSMATPTFNLATQGCIMYVCFVWSFSFGFVNFKFPQVAAPVALVPHHQVHHVGSLTTKHHHILMIVSYQSTLPPISMMFYCRCPLHLWLGFHNTMHTTLILELESRQFWLD